VQLGSLSVSVTTYMSVGVRLGAGATWIQEGRTTITAGSSSRLSLGTPFSHSSSLSRTLRQADTTLKLRACTWSATPRGSSTERSSSPHTEPSELSCRPGLNGTSAAELTLT
jgi:hypothetical protein